MPMLPYRAGLWFYSLFGNCVLCRTNSIAFGYLCKSCDSHMVWLPTPFVVPISSADVLSVQASGYYEGAMKRAIVAFKDNENLQTLPLLVHALAKLADNLANLPNDTVIVPVPTTQGRLTERGFYPVLVLARYLSALTGFAIYQGVVRPHETRHQRGLDRAERLNNLQGAFVLEYLPPSQNLLLFDDVATTGATLVEITKALRQACPQAQISAVCLAHGNSWFETHGRTEC